MRHSEKLNKQELNKKKYDRKINNTTARVD